jgi:hydrogenase nickel incorporation protein HypA/HybF
VHELALMEGVLEAVRERLGERRVARIRLRVGRLLAVDPRAMRFCYDVCTKGSAMEGALLQIDEIAARVHCRSCKSESELRDEVALCPCGSSDLDVLAGRELAIAEVEVD